MKNTLAGGFSIGGISIIAGVILMTMKLLGISWVTWSYWTLSIFTIWPILSVIFFVIFAYIFIGVTTVLISFGLISKRKDKDE